MCLNRIIGYLWCECVIVNQAADMKDVNMIYSRMVISWLIIKISGLLYWKHFMKLMCMCTMCCWWNCNVMIITFYLWVSLHFDVYAQWQLRERKKKNCLWSEENSSLYRTLSYNKYRNICPKLIHFVYRLWSKAILVKLQWIQRLLLYIKASDPFICFAIGFYGLFDIFQWKLTK